MMGFLRRLFSRTKPALAEAGPRDAASIAALHAASFHRGWSEEEVERLLVERSVMTHRAALGAKLAGFIMSRRAADEAEILSVAVFLEVDETNVPAIRLYRRAGFRDVGKRPNYYAVPGAKPVAALVLRRDLA